MKVASFVFLFLFAAAVSLNAQDDKQKKSSCGDHKEVKIEKTVNHTDCKTTAGLKDKETKKVVKKEKVVVTDGEKKSCSKECEVTCEGEE